MAGLIVHGQELVRVWAIDRLAHTYIDKTCTHTHTTHVHSDTQDTHTHAHTQPALCLIARLTLNPKP